jgi:hypothetical protein
MWLQMDSKDLQSVSDGPLFIRYPFLVDTFTLAVAFQAARVANSTVAYFFSPSPNLALILLGIVVVDHAPHPLRKVCGLTWE